MPPSQAQQYRTHQRGGYSHSRHVEGYAETGLGDTRLTAMDGLVAGAGRNQEVFPRGRTPEPNRNQQT